MREPENAQKAVVEKKKEKIEERGKAIVVAATSAAK